MSNSIKSLLSVWEKDQIDHMTSLQPKRKTIQNASEWAPEQIEFQFEYFVWMNR